MHERIRNGQALDNLSSPSPLCDDLGFPADGEGGGVLLLGPKVCWILLAADLMAEHWDTNHGDADGCAVLIGARSNGAISKPYNIN